MFDKFKDFGYNHYKKFRSKFNKIIVKRKKRHIELIDIVYDLKKIGIKQGDTLLLHSSLKKLGYVVGGPNTVIKAILEVIGSEGTLAIPTYPLSGTMLSKCRKKNYIFDYKTTPTGLGSIPTEFLKIEGVHRSIHPTHSISAIGKYAKKITEKHHIGSKTYGENSPWAKILELNGKIMGIGVSLGPTTQYHYVEDIMGNTFPIKVNVDEIYKIKCKIDEINYIDVEVQPLDPEVSKTRIDHKENWFIRDYFWEIHEKMGILNIGKIGEANSWWANGKDFCELIKRLAKLGITIYSTEKELKNMNLYPFDAIKTKI